MRGHVRRRGKTWCFVIDDGRDPETGKRRQRWQSGFATRKLAEEELRKALGRLDVGDDPIPPKITVAEHAERWFEHRERQGKPRPKGRKDQERLIRKRVLPVIGGLELRKVRPAHLQVPLDKMAAEGKEPRTVGHLKSTMSKMFATAVQWGLITVNPVAATTTPTVQRAKTKTPTVAELRALDDAARGTPHEVPIMMATNLGARRSEILGSRWRHCDLERGVLRVTESLQRVVGELVFTAPKTESAVREIPLTADVAARLKAHRAAQAERRLAFGSDWHDLDLICDRGDGGPLDPDAFTHAFVRIARSIGLDGVRLHDCRHGVATMLARSGLHPFETSKILGHSSVSFTANTYQHADRQSFEATRARLEEAFGR